MAKKTTKTNEIDYSDTRNSVELYLAKAIGENVTLPLTDNERILVYLRKLIEVIEQSGGSEVIPNPTLIGTEDTLSGIEVDGTKYKVIIPKELYTHSLRISLQSGVIFATVLSDFSTPFTSTTFGEYLQAKYNEDTAGIAVTGYTQSSSNWYIVNALKYKTSTNRIYYFGSTIGAYSASNFMNYITITDVTDTVTKIL